MAYDPRSIANFFIKKANEKEKIITHLKLQKLCYFAYGWYLAITNHRLFNELIEAWKYGPVIKTIFDEFKIHGKNPITEPAYEIDPNTLSKIPIPLPKNEADLDFLTRIWEVYGNIHALQLSEMTHANGTPWEQTYTEGIPQNTPITDEIIKEYFMEKLERNRRARQ